MDNVDTKNVTNATEKVKALNTIKNKATANEINAAISAIIEAEKEDVESATIAAAALLKTELLLLPETLRQLPDAVKKEAEANIEDLKKKSSSIWAKIGGEKVLNFAKSNVAAAMEGSGLNTALTKVGEFAGKIGEWANGMWEALKPHLAKMAETPGIAFLIGKDNLKNLQDWLGYDGDTVDIQKSFRARLLSTVVFTITTKQEVTAFKDLYKNMLSKKAKGAEYSREDFVAELLDNSKLGEYKSGTTKKELQMATVISIARIYVDSIQKETPAPPVAAATTAASTTPK